MTLQLQYGQICSQFDSRVLIYERKMFIILATGITKLIAKV